MVDYYLGEITMFAGNYAPQDWMFCDGAILPISQFQALYALLGTTYGGDGINTFQLPDLRNRFPMHQGPNFRQGEKGGTLTTHITVDNMPKHSHTITASTQNATLAEPENNVLSVPQSRYTTNVYGPKDPDTTTNMHEKSIGDTGGSQPLQILPPFLTINFIICVNGIFPPRS